MSHALVTGAGGFVGRVLCESLVDMDVQVTALHRRSRPGPWSHEILRDLATEGLGARELGGVDTVFHLAGHAHAEERPGSDALHHRTSVEGTRRLLDACGPNVRRLVYMSSVKAMGESTPPECVDESVEPRPETAYGLARLQAERLVLADNARRHAVVLRLPLVYGGGAKGNLARMLHAIDAGRMPLLPEFGNRRSMVHVRDACAAAIAAVQRPACAGRAYLLGDGEPYSTRRIQTLMFEALGRPLPRWSVPRWCLKMAALGGDVLRAAGWRQAAFDSPALERLSGSACYRSHACCRRCSAAGRVGKNRPSISITA